MRTLYEDAPHWRYTEQPPLNTKLQLLCKNDELSVGAFKGAPLGENKSIIAWSGFPTRDKVVERELALP